MSQTVAQAGLDKGQAISDLLGVNKVAVDELIAGVTMSVDAGRKSREQITALEQISRRIDKIVDAINTVSIQTNMLAVNGSVEAARAGEFGKGFAVVSTDIRNLARESAENADRIKDTVKAIQDQIVTVRGDLAEIVEASVIEVEKNRQIATGLETVAKDMTVVLAGNKEILAGSDEILQGHQGGADRRRAGRRRRAGGGSRLDPRRPTPPRSRRRGPRNWPPRSRRSPRWPTSCRPPRNSPVALVQLQRETVSCPRS